MEERDNRKKNRGRGAEGGVHKETKKDRKRYLKISHEKRRRRVEGERRTEGGMRRVV